MQTCSAYVIFIGSIILKRKKLGKFFNFLHFVENIYPQALLVLHFTKVFLGKTF